MKKIIYTCLMMAIMFIGANTVGASTATCTYEYEFANIVVKYQYGQVPTNDVSYDNGNQKFKINSVKVINDDIVGNDGTISCPNFVVNKKADGNKKFKVDLTASKDGSLVGTLNIINDDGKEKEKPLSGNHTCTYNKGEDEEYKLTWNGSSTIVNLTGKGITGYSYTILQDFSASDFENDKCPKSYMICPKKQNTKKCTISSQDQSLFHEDEGDPEDTDTGEKINPTDDEDEESTDIVPTAGETAKLVKELYGIAKIAIPVLIVLLSIVDFLKVVLLSDEKDYKSAWSKFIKRIVIGIIFFIVPALVSLIINISGIDTTQNFLEIFK